MGFLRKAGLPGDFQQSFGSNPRVNWSHPIARGLERFYIAHPFHGFFDATGNDSTIQWNPNNAGMAIGVGKDSWVRTPPDVDSSLESFKEWIPGGPPTVLVYYNAVGGHTSFDHLFDLGNEVAGGQGIGIQTQSGGTTLIPSYGTETSPGQYAQRNGNATTTNALAAGYHLVGASFVPTGAATTTVYTYEDGLARTSSAQSGLISFNEVAYEFFPAIAGVYGNGSHLIADYAAVLGWNRELSEAEHRLLWEFGIWQLLESDDLTSFYFAQTAASVSKDRTTRLGMYGGPRQVYVDGVKTMGVSAVVKDRTTRLGMYGGPRQVYGEFPKTENIPEVVGRKRPAGRTKRGKCEYPRRILIDGRVYWVRNPTEERQLIARYLESLKAVESSVEAVAPTESLRLKRLRTNIKRTQTRLDRTAERRAEWDALLDAEDEELLIILGRYG